MNKSWTTDPELYGINYKTYGVDVELHSKINLWSDKLWLSMGSVILCLLKSCHLHHLVNVKHKVYHGPYTNIKMLPNVAKVFDMLKAEYHTTVNNLIEALINNVDINKFYSYSKADKGYDFKVELGWKKKGKLEDLEWLIKNNI